MTTELTQAAVPRALAADEGERYWIAGDTLTLKATAADTGGAFTLIEILAGPGEGPPPHVHQNEDEAFYVLDGRFDILLGERVIDAGPGTFVLVPRGTVHRFRCVAERPSRLLVMFTPGGLEGFFRQVGIRATGDGPAPAGDVDEIARTEAAGARFGLQVVNWAARSSASR
jgi:quercetin dioxygenase-like cupin family protein